MDSNGFLCVLIGPYESLLLLMGPYGSLWVFIGPYASLCVFMGPYSSFYSAVHNSGATLQKHSFFGFQV